MFFLKSCYERHLLWETASLYCHFTWWYKEIVNLFSEYKTELRWNIFLNHKKKQHTNDLMREIVSYESLKISRTSFLFLNDFISFDLRFFQDHLLKQTYIQHLNEISSAFAIFRVFFWFCFHLFLTMHAFEIFLDS